MSDSTRDIEKQLREEIVRFGKLMHQRRYVAATDGNITVRLGEDRLLATPSGVSKGMMTPDLLVVTDMDGRPLDKRQKPSAEIRTHLACYRKRSDVRAVVHAHPPFSTALTIAGISLAPCVIPEVVFTLGSIPTCRYATPASADVPKVIENMIGNFDAILLDRHGTLTVGGTLFDAYKKLEKVEHTAEIIFYARQIGAVRTLPPHEIEHLLAIRKSMGLRDIHLACDQCGVCLRPRVRNTEQKGEES